MTNRQILEDELFGNAAVDPGVRAPLALEQWLREDFTIAATGSTEERTLADWLASSSTATIVTELDLRDAEADINVTNKFQGRTAYDTTNHRLMVADGSDPEDPWYVCDGSGVITPVVPGVIPDVTAPVVIEFNPPDNSTGIPLNTDLVVTFDEPVTLGAGNITLKRTSDNVTIEAWDVETEVGSLPGQVEAVNEVLTMRLTSTLANNIGYYVIWDAGVVKDAADNNVAVQASTTLWSFTSVALGEINLDFANGTYGGGTLADMLTVTRASAEMVTNADGTVTSIAANLPAIGVGSGLHINQAGTNLLTQSQTLSTWTTERSTITAAAGEAPDGTWTATRITDNAVLGTHRVRANTVTFTSGQLYTWSVYLKAETTIYAQVYTSAPSVHEPHVTVALTDDDHQVAGSIVGGDAAIINPQIEALANGWCRVSFSMTCDATASTAGMHIMLCTGPNANYGNAQYTGVGSSMLVWGADLKNGPLTPYVPTTTAAATRAGDVIAAAGVLKTALEAPSMRCVIETSQIGGGAMQFPATLLGVGAADTGLSIETGFIPRTTWGTGTLSNPAQIVKYGVNKLGLGADVTGRSVAINGQTIASDANAVSAVSAEHIGTLSDGTVALNGVITRIRVWDDRDDVAMVAATANSAAPTNLTPYTGQVATKTFIPQNLLTTPKQFQSRLRHRMLENVTSLQIILPNFRVGSLEEAPGATATVTASIEYPAGVFTQVLFSGIASGTIPNGGMLTSDVVTVTIPAGAFFFTRVFWNSTAGIICSEGLQAVDRWNGSAMVTAVSGLTDHTMSGTIVDEVLARMYAPVAIIGTTIRPAILFVGDSLSLGYFDELSDLNNDRGLVARSVSPTFAYLDQAVGGDRGEWYLQGHTNRLALAQYCTHVICSHGHNDVHDTSRTLAELQDDFADLWALFSVPVYQITATPLASSTDNFQTVENQTTSSRVTVLNAFNDWVRTTPAGIDGYFEIADVLMSSRNSGKWVVDGGNFYVGGFNGDGVHINMNGNMMVRNNGVVDVMAMVEHS